jgi:hypothetical protein
MFNLGTKQLCLLPEHRQMGNLQDLGQSQQFAAAGRQGISVAKKCSGEVWHNPPVTPYDDTKTYDIGHGDIRSERVLSNIFSDIDVWTFNLKQVVLTLVGRLLQLKLQDLTIR